MSRGYKVAILAALLATVALIIGLVIPTPSTWTGSEHAFHAPLATSIVTFVLYIYAAILFIMGASAYKARMKVAYTFVTAALTLNAIGAIQLPLIEASDIESTVLYQSGLLVAPFMFAGLLLYIGVRGFAKLVGSKNILTRASIVIASALVLAAASALIPHPGGANATSFAINALLVWTGSFYLSSAILLVGVHKNIGEHYKKATAWLFVSLLGGNTVLLLALFSDLIATVFPDIRIAINYISVVGSTLYLKAGYEFYKTKDY